MPCNNVKFGKILTFEDERSVRANEHSACASTTYGPCTALGVDSNISSEDDSVPAVPRRSFNPVDGVEKSSGRSVARVLGVDAFDISVASGGEEIHEHRLDRLRLVDDGLGADVDTADGLGVDVVLLDQARDSCTSKY